MKSSIKTEILSNIDTASLYKKIREIKEQK